MKKDLDVTNNKFANMSKSEILKDHHEALCQISEGLHKLKKLNEKGSTKLRTDFMQTTEDTIVDYLTANRILSDEEHEEVTVSLDEAIDVVESRLRMLEQIFASEVEYPRRENAYKMYPVDIYGYTYRHAKFAEDLGLGISPAVKKGMCETAKKTDNDAINELVQMKEEFKKHHYNKEDEDKWRKTYNNRISDWMNEISAYFFLCYHEYVKQHYTDEYLKEIGYDGWQKQPDVIGRHMWDLCENTWTKDWQKARKSHAKTRVLDVDKYIESLIKKKNKKN